MNYWLLKSEPEAFSIDDLMGLPKKTDHWDGIRNYQARNFMRDDMKKKDLAFFYHSNCDQPGIIGIVEVTREGYPDYTALEPESKYYDPKSSAEKNPWVMVDVKFKKKFPRTITLKELKENRKLDGMRLLQKGNRLSIMPVTKKEWDLILGLV